METSVTRNNIIVDFFSTGDESSATSDVSWTPRLHHKSRRNPTPLHKKSKLAKISAVSLNRVKKTKGKDCGSQSTRALFGPNEKCYTIDARVAGNISRYINVRIVTKYSCVYYYYPFKHETICLFAFSTLASPTLLCKTFSSIRTICISRGLHSSLVPTFVLAPNLRGTTVMKSAVSLGKKSFAIAVPRSAEEGCFKPLYSYVSLLT